MNISTATDYGMQSLLYLAGLYERDKYGLATTKEIAESQNLPQKYLEAILRSTVCIHKYVNYTID
jgi:DNA-binding IscR family transcriptional regulator